MWVRFQQDPGAKSSEKDRQREREGGANDSFCIWKQREWDKRHEGWRLKLCEPRYWKASDTVHCTLFSIYSHCFFIGFSHRKQITIFIINPNISLPPTGLTCPQSRATLPCLGGQGSLPARQLQVMACEMTGLLLVGRLDGGPGSLFMELLWSFSWPQHLYIHREG